MTILLSRSGSGSRAYTILNAMQKPPEFNNYSRTQYDRHFSYQNFSVKALSFLKRPRPQVSRISLVTETFFSIHTYIMVHTYSLKLPDECGRLQTRDTKQQAVAIKRCISSEAWNYLSITPEKLSTLEKWLHRYYLEYVHTYIRLLRLPLQGFSVTMGQLFTTNQI